MFGKAFCSILALGLVASSALAADAPTAPAPPAVCGAPCPPPPPLQPPSQPLVPPPPTPLVLKKARPPRPAPVLSAEAMRRLRAHRHDDGGFGVAWGLVPGLGQLGAAGFGYFAVDHCWTYQPVYDINGYYFGQRRVNVCVDLGP